MLLRLPVNNFKEKSAQERCGWQKMDFFTDAKGM